MLQMNRLFQANYLQFFYALDFRLQVIVIDQSWRRCPW